MAICINIDKCIGIKKDFVYHVETVDRGGFDFYVVISSEQNTIAFYVDQDLKQLLRVVDLNNPKETIDVPCIDSMISARVIGQCARALRENGFPKSIGYYA